MGAAAQRFNGRGYAYVAQDCRGRFASEGVFYPWFHEADDGTDTLKWIEAQPWCNGRIGMVGGSYNGLVQWLAAARGTALLRCIVPRVCTSNFYDSPNYAGGAFQLALNMLWGFRMGGSSPPGAEAGEWNWQELFCTLPLYSADEATGQTLPYWRDWVRHPRYDAYWEQVNIEEHYARIRTPALIVGGWYDLYAKQTLTNFRGMREQGGTGVARRNTRAVIGPWGHAINVYTKTGDVDFGPDSLVDLEGMEAAFLDRWLCDARGVSAEDTPLRLFIMGANVWRGENEWPLARTRWTKLFLHSDGSANTRSGDGTLSTAVPGGEPCDVFPYDPGDPVPTRGGNTCCSPDIVPYGPFDQGDVEDRRDVLVFTSAPLTENLEVTGPIRVVLYASSSARDTDFTAKLVDVFPDGYAMNLCDGIIRGRYRRSFRRASFLKPGTVYEFNIDCWVTANVFLRGHRIRLDISSSNFPRFDRNPNTGHTFGVDAELRTARQRVFHTNQYPSHIVLPVIPPSG
jgi:putative CocE/NonD family hydrolase